MLKYAKMPMTTTAADSSTVIAGRRMQSSEMFMRVPGAAA